MNMSKSYILAGLAGTALLSAIALTVPFPQFLQAALFLLLGLVLTVLTAAYVKNLDTLNMQGRIISALAEFHAQSSANQAVQVVESTLGRLFPQTPLYRYPPREEDEAMPWGWEVAQEVTSQSLARGQAIMLSRSQGETALPAGVENLAVLPVGGRYQALILANLPAHISRRNLQLVLATLHNHLQVVQSRIDRQKQEQELWEELLGAAVTAMESHDPVFCGHARRVARMSRLIGQRLGMSGEELHQLVGAAWLHDLGRWAAPDPESPELDHASCGAQTITESLTEVRSAVCHHHERYDGSGYPLGLKYTEIPLAARIIAVADVYDALTSLEGETERCEHQAALGVIKKSIGTQFDPLVVVAFEEVAPELEETAMDPE